MMARMQTKGSPYELLVGMYTSLATIGISTEVSQKLRDLPYDSALYLNRRMQVNLHINVYGGIIHNR